MAIDMDMDMDMDIELGVSVHRTRTPPDSDTDTPPRHPPTKRVHHNNYTHGLAHAPGVSYKECMKNHAASIGGHALDGCCEFMAGPTFNPMDPTSLKCGACGCHRNFHRRDPDDPTPLNHHPTSARRPHSPPSASQLLLSLSQSPSGPSDEVNPTPVNLPGNIIVGYSGGGQDGNFTSSVSGSSKKRFRTKFTQEQKDKMYVFSEKIGWKLKKGEERLVEDFVKQIGVERSVFKVWMHNNKHNSSSSSTTPKPRLVDIQNTNDYHNPKPEPAVETTTTTAATTAVASNYVLLQHSNGGSSKSNNSSSNNNNNNTNCGASVFDNHNHNLNHHRQFNFGNGGSQEATQAQ